MYELYLERVGLAVNDTHQTFIPSPPSKMSKRGNGTHLELYFHDYSEQFRFISMAMKTQHRIRLFVLKHTYLLAPILPNDVYTLL